MCGLPETIAEGGQDVSPPSNDDPRVGGVDSSVALQGVARQLGDLPRHRPLLVRRRSTAKTWLLFGRRRPLPTPPSRMRRRSPSSSASSIAFMPGATG
jgi:hypothetical protein